MRLTLTRWWRASCCAPTTWAPGSSGAATSSWPTCLAWPRWGTPARRAGTLFIEIDGLGYGHLQEALRGGTCRSRALIERAVPAYRWRCASPPIRPPSRAGSAPHGTWLVRRQGSPVPTARGRGESGTTCASGGRARTCPRRAGRRACRPGAVPPRTSCPAALVGADHRRRQSPGDRPGQGLLLALAVLALNPGKVLQFGFDALWELLQEMEDRVYVNAMDRPRVLEGLSHRAALSQHPRARDSDRRHADRPAAASR